jgi:hypothetical protein
MPNSVNSVGHQLNAKQVFLASIRHSPGFGIASIMPHAA